MRNFICRVQRFFPDIGRRYLHGILSGEIHQAAGNTKMEILERSELMLMYTQK